MHILVPPVSRAEIQKGSPEESSEAIKQRAAEARRRAISRFPTRPAFRNIVYFLDVR
jgi:predicted ATPase with chaperone activity